MRIETRIVYGRPRLFLVANRDIHPNEILYWDYMVSGSDEAKDYKYFATIKSLNGLVVLDSKNKLNSVTSSVPSNIQKTFA